MKIFQRKRLSVLLAGLFCFMSVMHYALPARADNAHPDDEVDGITYEWNDEREIYVGAVGPEGPNNDISVPAGYHLVMGDGEGMMGENTLSGITVSLSSGSCLEIWGNVNFQGSISASDGAYLETYGVSSVPSDITLCEEDGATPFAGEGWSNAFCYLGGSGVWAYLPPPPSVTVAFGGFDPDTDSVTIEYKYTGEQNYRSADDYNPWEDENIPGNFEGFFELAEIPDNWDNQVDIKVTLSSTRSAVMLAADDGNNNLSTYISNNGSEFNVNITYDDCDWLGISLGYPDSGNPEIAEKACEYLYAYCSAEGKTVEQLFAEELVCRLMDPSLFEYFGMEDYTRTQRISELENRITVSTEAGAQYQVTATKPDGSSETINVQKYKVTWGNSNINGSEVSCTLPVYTLNNVHQVLICTDFNKQDGSGTSFYICDLTTDRIDFSDAPGAGDGGIPFHVDSVNPSTIKAGGMGRGENILNDSGMCTIEVHSEYLRETHPVNDGERIRFLKNSGKYVVVKGTGESGIYGQIGDNGSNVDGVWATGNNGNAVARVYVGESTVHLYPLSSTNTGLSGTGIQSVELADSTQVDGVTLNANDLDDVTLTFRSYFYDEVPLRITFSDNTVKYLTVIRVGLVIQYVYLDGDPDHPNQSGSDHGQINLDYRGNDSIGFDYDYYAGEQIAIWATYYHPSYDPTGGTSYYLYLTRDDGVYVPPLEADDNDHNFHGSRAADGTHVASTTFLIGFTQAWGTFYNDEVWINQLNEINYGGFSATVVNAGYDDDTTYGGTQIGSGRGVYWDGHITFYR